MLQPFSRESPLNVLEGPIWRTRKDLIKLLKGGAFAEFAILLHFPDSTKPAAGKELNNGKKEQ